LGTKPRAFFWRKTLFFHCESNESGSVQLCEVIKAAAQNEFEMTKVGDGKSVTFLK